VTQIILAAKNRGKLATSRQVVYEKTTSRSISI
jgi:hypothetical protein